MNPINKVFKEGEESALNFAAKKLHSNEAINKAFNVLGNGAIDCWNVAAKSIEQEGNIVKAFDDVFKKEGTYDMKRIAGAGFIAGAGMRVATGGGLYRDRNGSQDLIGIPFI